MLADSFNGRIAADVVQFVPLDSAHTATWTPDLSEAGTYEVLAWWSAFPDRAIDATYTIHHDGGGTAVTVDQRVDGGAWNSLGIYQFTPGQNHRVHLTDATTGRVAVDAILFKRLGGLPNRVIWSPALSSRDLYDVQTKWWAHANHTAAGPVTVTHEDGQSSQTINQQTNNNTWTSLGHYVLAPAAGYNVTLTGEGGETYADVVRFAPAERSTPRLAVWSFQVPTAEDYAVYAKWPEAPEHASNAIYSVHHAGGTSTVARSQRQGGGAWNLLGTFSFAAGADYRVELSDQGDGTVVADAIYVVKAARSYDSYSWAPTLPSAGDYAVYAKWAADAGRAA